jgi:hypothetical protein
MCWLVRSLHSSDYSDLFVPRLPSCAIESSSSLPIPEKDRDLLYRLPTSYPSEQDCARLFFSEMKLEANLKIMSIKVSANVAVDQVLSVGIRISFESTCWLYI